MHNPRETALARHASAVDVSVVIPTFNRERFVVEAVQSVLGQTVAPGEVVVVDDGSTDGSRQALRPYRDRIRYIFQENRGEAAARNRGVAEARGAWIAFLDSDDLWEPHAVETLLRALQRHPEAGLVAMRARGLNPDGGRHERTFGKKSPGPFFSTTSLLLRDAGGVLTPLVRRNVLLGAGGFDETLRSATDVDMWLRLSFQTLLVGVPEVLLLRRFHAGSVSRDMALNARMWLRVLDKLAREHPEFVRRHPWVYRRALGKERLRLGRELLAAGQTDLGDRSGASGRPGRGAWTEARFWLRRSVAAFPFFLRSWMYLGWSYVTPRTYSRWRDMERRRHQPRSAAQGSGRAVGRARADARERDSGQGLERPPRR